MINNLDKKKIVIFDFDGVIADSFEYALETIQKVCPGTTRELYLRSYWGNNLENTNVYSNMSVEDEKRIFQQYYEKELYKITLFPKMADVVKQLAKEHKLIMVSSSPLEVLEFILKRENLLDRFSMIYDGYHYPMNKTKKFKMILQENDLQASDCIFITDTLGDLREAEKAGIESIAVSWGFHGEDILKKGKYKTIVNSPKELTMAIGKYLN